MDTAIQIVWSIGLAGALVFTAIILKEVALLLRTLADILRLAEYIRDASRGVARHVQGARHLVGVVQPAVELTARAQTVGEAVTLVGEKLGVRLGGRRDAGRGPEGG